MISISTKVKLITIVLSLMMIFNLFVTYYLIQDEKADAQIINIAGKQRMLTQKMIAESYKQSIDSEHTSTPLFMAKNEFNTNLERLYSGDLSLDKNVEVHLLLNDVKNSWNEFEDLMSKNANKSSTQELNLLYTQANKTLELMDKTVSAYENYATDKRDFINNIQLLLGVFALLVIVYMGYISLGIDKQLRKFLKHSSDISGRKPTSKGSELDLACEHIQYFLDDVEAAIDSAALAVEQSEKASIKLAKNNKDLQGQVHLDMSEDIVIEANEELYKTSILLKKLKTKLQNAAHPTFK